MDAMKFPLRFNETNGGLAMTEEGTDDYYRQLLSVAARTEPGAHPITPEFGIMDPTFKSIDRGQFLFAAARFVPEIEVVSVETTLTGDGANIVNFSFIKRPEM
ncbi:MAG: hypothetical protein CL489_00930 [Acidobacteria bacterium]|jgi:hypothetical protein|nr:hypothetical protein [Acidobacteriota bacterium]